MSLTYEQKILIWSFVDVTLGGTFLSSKPLSYLNTSFSENILRTLKIGP